MTTAATGWTNPPADAGELIEWFHAMRERAPVQEHPQRGEWHIFGYEEGKAVLDNHHAFSNAVSALLLPADSPFLLFREGNLSVMDPPRHQQIRALVRSVFTPSYIRSVEPMVRAVTAGVLDRVAGASEFAFVQQLATPIVSTVMANLVGIPAADNAQFGRWGATVMALTDPASTENGMAAFIAETKLMHAYLHEFVADRRQHPGTDLTSRLTQARIDDASLSDAEVAGLIALLMNTGVTSNQLLVNAMICLDQQPIAQARVRSEPDLFGPFVDEALRHRGQTPRVERFSLDEVTIGGCAIPHGRHVSVWLSAANRDPRRFANPDVFDMSRSPNAHLAFGHGVHYCLGAALGRVQTAVALNRLLALTEAVSIDYERSRILDPRMVVGAAELTLRVRWNAP